MLDEQDGEEVYTCDRCVIPFGDAIGWEAAVFDHYQSLVKAICAKLETGGKSSEERDTIGGSTYKFYINPEHPMHDEVMGLLSSARASLGELRERVTEHNRVHDLSADRLDEVVFYTGQFVIRNTKESPS